MPIQIVKNDITTLDCDAIVNSTNKTLVGGIGVNGAIHRAAGRGLFLECMKLGGCKPGNAKITLSYNLPCDFVIHTVGPKWKGGCFGERELLISCYEKCLMLAVEYNCTSIAFPLISSGAHGFPKDEVMKIAMTVINGFLQYYDLSVYIVVYDKNDYDLGQNLFYDIESFIDRNYVYNKMDGFPTTLELYPDVISIPESSPPVRPSVNYSDNVVSQMIPPTTHKMDYQQMSVADGMLQAESISLSKMIFEIDESFSQMLLRKIDERGISDAECYKKANIDRKLFSKIKSNIYYQPRKTTAIAFAIALELSLEETKDLLMKAGFALSRSNKFDVIIEYFITRRNYNIFEINEALFAFDQSLLGA